MFDLLFTDGSYLGITVFLILTGCGLPIPEEVPIVMAGVWSAQGSMDPGLALACCLVGALVGDSIMYAIGYHWGHNLLKEHPLFARFVRADREPKFEAMIQSHGLKVLLLARFMVGVRSPVYLSAGVLRVPFRRFLLMDLLCATLVVSIVFGLSYFYGMQIFEWVFDAEKGLTVAVLVAVAAVGGFYYLRRRKRLAEKREREQTVHPSLDRDEADNKHEEHEGCAR